MGVRLNEGDLRSLLRLAVLSELPEDRLLHQDRLIEHLYSTETLEVWGRGLAKHYGRPGDHEEITQVVSEEVIRYLRVIDAETLEQVDNVATHLFFKGKVAVVRFLDSPAVTVATAMSGVSRRYRQSMVARQEFVATFSRDPSNAELVEFINARIRLTRKNPEKQGALVTEDDVSGRMLHPHSMNLNIEDSDSPAESFGTPTQDNTVRERGELAVTVHRLGQVADDLFPKVHSPSVREVLAVWMEFVLDNEPPITTEIAARLSVSRQTASERMKMVERVLEAIRGE